MAVLRNRSKLQPAAAPQVPAGPPDRHPRLASKNPSRAKKNKINEKVIAKKMNPKPQHKANTPPALRHRKQRTLR